MKLLTILLLAMVCLSASGRRWIPPQPAPPGGGGGITHDATSTGSDFDGDLTSSFSHSQGSLTNGYVVVAISCYLPGAPDGVTAVSYDSASMTLIGTTQEPANAYTEVYLWGLAVGTKGSGSYTVSVTNNGGVSTEFVMGCVSFSGVHQTTSLGTAASANGDSTAPSVNVSSATNEVVIGVVGSYQGTLTAGAGQTIGAWSIVDGSSLTDGAGSAEAGTTTTTFSYTKGTSGLWSIIAVPLKPSA